MKRSLSQTFTPNKLAKKNYQSQLSKLCDEYKIRETRKILSNIRLYPVLVSKRHNLIRYRKFGIEMITQTEPY